MQKGSKAYHHRTAKPTFTVIVTGVGQVYKDIDKTKAYDIFNEHKNNGKRVTLFDDLTGKILENSDHVILI